MADRITAAYIERLLDSLTRELIEAELLPDTARVCLTQGSRAAGRQYRIHAAPQYSGAEWMLPGIGYVESFSRSEVIGRAEAMRDALSAANAVRSADRGEYVRRAVAKLAEDEQA